MRTRTFDDRGSASIEAAIGVPALGLFIVLLIFAGRVAVTHQAVDSAAFEAARSASLARSAADASSQASAAATAALANQGLRCGSTSVDVDASGFRAAVGTPASVTVTVTCVVDLTDLTVPMPGSHTVTSTATSPIDTWRQR